MVTDKYTKVVLTIIAICLTFNILMDLEIVPTAKAKTNRDAIDVNIVGCPTIVDVNIKRVNGSWCDYPLKVVTE